MKLEDKIRKKSRRIGILYITNVTAQYVGEIVTDFKEIRWTGIKDMTATGIKLCVLYTAHK
jgi:hypothetical protein